MQEKTVYLQTVIHGAGVSVKAMSPLPVGIDLKMDKLTGVDHTELVNLRHVLVKLYHDRCSPETVKQEISDLLGNVWRCFDEDNNDELIELS